MFRKVTDTFYASPQITTEDIAEASGLGVRLVINNRPEGESDDQTPGAVIEEAARAAGMDYLAIPVTHAGFSETQVSAMAKPSARFDKVSMTSPQKPNGPLASDRPRTR